MKIFYSEGNPDYSSYTFNYGVYCIKETQSELPEIYNLGFLPYSGNPSLQYEIFYLARSLRVDVSRFQDSSENRRVNRKILELEISMECHPKKILLEEDQEFDNFSRHYTRERIGDAMSEQRLSYILGMSTGSHMFRFLHQGQPVGYVLCCIEGNTLHYWFSFFDIDLMQKYSLGKWMMWKVISWAEEHQLDHVYLGTCYGTKSLYKARDHKGLAFFDGSGWNDDIQLLKSWCKLDIERLESDRLKSSDDQNQYIQSIVEK